ncbi:MAG TPA: hypothetical protein ENK14_10200 [Caldithrix sp.]|nr:hypothetical protein [Caldithrix sp.]
MASREYVERIFNFQKMKSKELKRPVTYSEALAMWFSQLPKIQPMKKKFADKLNWESTIY